MECSMEWKSNTESVIAKLMGLDQLRPRQRLYKNQRVLSEGYIRKISTIAIRRGSLVSTGRLHWIKPEDVDAVKDVSGIEALENASKNKRIQNLEFDPKDVTKTAIMEPELENVTYRFKDGIPDTCSKSRDREQNDYMFPERGNYQHHHDPGLMSEKVVINGITSPKCSCIDCVQNTNKASQKVLGSSKLAELSIPGYAGNKSLANDQDMENGHASPLSPNQPSPKKQIFERWTRSKVIRRIEFSERGESPKMLALANKESAAGKVKYSLSSDWNLKKDYFTPEFKSVADILEPKGGSKRDEFQTAPAVNDTLLLSSEISEDIHVIHELTPRNSMTSIGKLEARSKIDDTSFASAEAPSEPQLEPNPYDHQDFVGEALRNEFSDELAHSNSSLIGTPEFRENLKRANQHSPDSVLKSFHEQFYSNDQCFDSIGLQLQLQVLNLETEDSNSEESVMDVSGDDNSEEQSSDFSHDGRCVRRWIGDIESRNFSYMVDVLDEAGFCGIKPCMDPKAWHSLECPISPLVFEALEKKYGKQASWEKAERRLLFDNINFGLMAIFNPVMNFYPSVQRTLCPNPRRDEVEDELWSMLICQERETSEKALEKWFETEEGMTLICSELTTSLFDELVDEFVILLKC